MILASAFEVFSKNGYLNSSMAEIARGAEMTVPGITNHFPTKAQLLEEVLKERDLDANNHLLGRHGADLLRGVLNIVSRDEAEDNLTQLFAILSAEASVADHPAHQYFTQRYEVVLENVTRGFAEAAKEGQLRTGVDPEAAAQFLIALSDGLQLQRLYRVGKHSQTELMRTFLDNQLIDAP
ncbi:TetR family transcriptional regulator [Glutamicibacter sp. NPDC087344]|uniref:TetR family transcriptional regulator n=1 Tax=Glutamicibacter sp. NPDC087344 TaxID=3363994 RepID=UPI0038036831